MAGVPFSKCFAASKASIRLRNKTRAEYTKRQKQGGRTAATGEDDGGDEDEDEDAEVQDMLDAHAFDEDVDGN